MLSIKEIIMATGGKANSVVTDLEIKGVHFDSREIKVDYLFIALEKGNTDGHNYLKNAKENGAIAAIVSKEEIDNNGLITILVENTEKALQELASYYRQKMGKKVIAITGSNGKTTTKDIISSVLSIKLNVHKTKGNFNNHLGLPLTILQAKDEHDVLVLEAGMNHFGELDLLGSIAKPDISVVTNIGDAHIEFFGTKENIAHAKGELLPHTKKDGFVLINGKTNCVKILKEKFPGEKILYGIGHNILAKDIRSNDNGTSFTLILEDKKYQVSVPLFGEHNVENSLSAIYIAYRLGFSIEEIKEALENLSISAMRFEVSNRENGVTIINDAYNASPTSMKASIKTFHSIFPEKSKVVVLGDMFELGENEKELHREIGLFLNEYIDKTEKLITVGKNSAYISHSFKGEKLHCSSKEEAIRSLAPYLNEKSIILFKASRGMKLEEIIKAID